MMAHVSGNISTFKVVKFLWNFEPETSKFGRCYLSNLLDAADMV